MLIRAVYENGYLRLPRLMTNIRLKSGLNANTSTYRKTNWRLFSVPVVAWLTWLQSLFTRP